MHYSADTGEVDLLWKRASKLTEGVWTWRRSSARDTATGILRSHVVGSTFAGPAVVNSGQTSASMVIKAFQFTNQPILQDGIQIPGVPTPHPGCVGNGQRREKVPGSGDQPQDVPSPPDSATHTDKIEEMLAKIANDKVGIQVTDVALGLRQVPASFYTIWEKHINIRRFDKQELSTEAFPSNELYMQWKITVKLKGTAEGSFTNTAFTTWPWMAMICLAH
ncbi:hypothetical protein HD554DRAFT_2325140 [Boletus coccyginus]|nr:hypothetical protein HD554DRAFT_2325140 [Boletus coccyginus]